MNNKLINISFLNSGTLAYETSQKNIFEKYKLPETHSPYNKGLGLNYSKMMCELHGGDLTYNITEDKLNEFIVKLPIVT